MLHKGNPTPLQFLDRQNIRVQIINPEKVIYCRFFVEGFDPFKNIVLKFNKIPAKAVSNWIHQ